MPKGNQNPRRQLKGIDVALLPDEPKQSAKKTKADSLEEAAAAIRNLSDADFYKLSKERVQSRLLANIEEGQDKAARSVEILAKLKGVDLMVHPTQATVNNNYLAISQGLAFLDDLDLGEPAKVLPPAERMKV